MISASALTFMRLVMLYSGAYFKPASCWYRITASCSFILVCILWFSVVNLTNRFHVAVRLFSNRSQMTSKCGKNKKVAHEAQPSVSQMFLPHFDVLCDLLLNRRTATWNPFVLYNKKIKIHGKNALLFEISPL